jgi:chorismate-pyruvate lyase
MSHPALTQLRALRYFDQIPALDPEQLDWLLLEDSMTKRFEQQGKTVTVTLIQEGFVTPEAIASELPLLPKKIATGCVRFYSVLMASRGWPGGRLCQNPPCAGRN